MFPDRQQLVAAALVASIVLSVAAFAGSAAGVETTVDGPDEVTKPDAFTLTSSVEIRDTERVPIENYTLTISPVDSDESLRFTFAPNGTIVDTDPEDGVVGEGAIKVTQLRQKAEIDPVDRNGSYGYGYGNGTDERSGEEVEFGYGYGYAGDGDQPTFTYDVELASTAFDRGDYEVSLTVNTDDETGLYQSNVQTFTVQTRGDEAGQGNGNDAGQGNGAADGDDADDESEDADGTDENDGDDEDEAGEPGRDDPGRGP